ncbi:hypothetical protein ACWEQU_31650 [Streptomyces nodosus]
MRALARRDGRGETAAPAGTGGPDAREAEDSRPDSRGRDGTI